MLIFLPGNSEVKNSIGNIVLSASVVLLIGCTPTLKVATDEPITINLNVNIKHEILVKVDKELDSLFSKEGDLF